MNTTANYSAKAWSGRELARVASTAATAYSKLVGSDTRAVMPTSLLLNI